MQPDLAQLKLRLVTLLGEMNAAIAHVRGELQRLEAGDRPLPEADALLGAGREALLRASDIATLLDELERLNLAPAEHGDLAHRVAGAVERITESLMLTPRRRFERILEELRNGRLLSEGTRRIGQARHLRNADTQVEELLTRPEAEVPTIPGPGGTGGSWVHWALDVEAEVYTALLDAIEPLAPSLSAFITAIHAYEWRWPANAPSSAPMPGLEAAQSSVWQPAEATAAQAAQVLSASSVQAPHSAAPRPPETPGEVPNGTEAVADTTSAPEGVPTTDASQAWAVSRTEPVHPAPDPTPELPRPGPLVSNAPSVELLRLVAPPVIEFTVHRDRIQAALPAGNAIAGQASVTAADRALGEATTKLEQFVAQHWIDPVGEVATAPWLNKAVFMKETAELARRALEGRRWGELLLACRAAAELGEPLVLDESDVIALCRIDGGELSVSIDSAQSRSARLNERVHEVSLESDLMHQTFVFLAAIAGEPHLTHPVFADAADLVDLGPIREALLTWVQMRMWGQNPLAEMRAIARPGLPLEDLEALRGQAYDGLRETIKNHRAPHREQVRTNHCKEAWARFMADAQPDLDRILETPDDLQHRQTLEDLRDEAQRLFDQANVRDLDRIWMDKAVARIIRAAGALLDSAAELRAARERAARNWQSRFTVPSVAEQDDLWRLLLKLTQDIADPDELPHLPWETVMVCPQLLRAWTNVLPGVPLRADTVSRPLVAVAALLSAQAGPTAPPSGQLTLDPSLLAHLQVLDPHQQNLADQHETRLRDEIDALGAEFEASIREHIDLGLGMDDLRAVQSLLRNSLEIERASEEQPRREPPLVEHMRMAWVWARRQRQQVLVRIDEAVNQLRSELSGSDGALRPEHEELFNQRAWVQLLRQLSREVGAHDSQIRSSAYRVASLSQGATAAQRRLDVLIRETDPSIPRKLIQAWLAVARQQTPTVPELEALREEFTEYVFQLNRIRGRKSNADLSVRKNMLEGTARASMSADSVLDWLTTESPHPNFLPQLRRYRRVQISTIAPRALTTGLRPAAERHKDDGSLTVVLAPGLAETQRRECVQEWRKTERHLAILDDQDLVRMVGEPGVRDHRITAMLELFLEQQPWSRTHPFEAGQSLQMEMFVGRTDEAHDLAHRSRYSRIFSGRKLGKTALLQAVARRYGGQKVAGADPLHVVYRSIAGVGHERELVDVLHRTIIDEIDREVPQPDDKLSANAALVELMDSLKSRHPKACFLFLLDEADLFVETQLESELAMGGERGLAWKMREIEGQPGAEVIQRVRFVVCGYRATHRSRGAWGNWGEVLRLKPLEASQAMDLVRGPLGRIGVQAEDVAAAAGYHCGNQPAVLLRLGALLVERLGQSTQTVARDHARVDLELVNRIVADPHFEDGVREVTWNNFEGNPIGKIVFAALLLELESRPSAAAVPEDPDALLDWVHQSRPGFDLTQHLPGGGTWADHVRRQLLDLEGRSLLVAVDRRPATYRLRFPHHLRILLKENPRAYIQNATQELEQRGRSTAEEAWVIPSAILDNARSVVASGKEFATHAIVFGSHWLEPLVGGRSNLRSRLGLDVPNEQPPGRATGTATPEIADRRLEAAVSSMGVDVLVGGADLLRWAVAQKHQNRDLDVEIAATGRLRQDQVLRWLTQRYSLEFRDRVRAAEEIGRVTGGIPLYLAYLDKAREALSLSETLTDLQVDLWLAAIPVAIIAQHLTENEAWCALDAREREVLQLAAAAAVSGLAGDPNVLREAMSTPELIGLPAIAPLGPSDVRSVAVLLGLGLLPRSEVASGSALDQLAPLDVNDPIIELVRHFGP